MNRIVKFLQHVRFCEGILLGEGGDKNNNSSGFLHVNREGADADELLAYNACQVFD